MKTKLFAAVLIPTAFSLFGLVGCIWYAGDLELYSITVNPSKTSVRVGETINIVVTYEHASDGDSVIELTEEATFRNYELEDILYVKVLLKGEKPNWVFEYPDIEQRTQKTIKKDAIISRTVKHTFKKRGNCTIHSAMFYYCSSEYYPDIPMQCIRGKPLNIKVW
jgi:hypothetical protein